jgi:hypothetical protein
VIYTTVAVRISSRPRKKHKEEAKEATEEKPAKHGKK